MKTTTNRLLELHTQHEHKVFQKELAIQEHELATSMRCQSKQSHFLERSIAHANDVLYMLTDVQI